MKFYQSVLVLGALALTTQLMASVSTTGPKVIYGEDNRVDVFESRKSMYVELAKSTAAMIPNSALRNETNGLVKIGGTTLQGRGICAKERFAKQPTAANCSGFLVGDKYLVTAGHCIENQVDCNNYKWVFDYKVDHSEQGSVDVEKTAIYSCKSIVERSLDGATQDDYAMIELDRVVTDREPLKFRQRGKPLANAALVVIGHPTGLPTKIADGANVRSHEAKFFRANLDTYGGNSGSAVFNAKSGMVEGILVRGENDYIYSSADRCQVSNVCPDTGCAGEDVTYITNIKALKTLGRN